jgi:hypothetical protein
MAAGVWGDTAGSYSGAAAGVIGTADNHYAGYFVNNGVDYYSVYSFNGSGPALLGESAAGTGVSGVSTAGGFGVYGSSSTAQGVYGSVNTSNYHQAGVEGVAVGHSDTYNVNLAAAVWGDNGTPGCGTCTLWNVGVAGTTGDNIAGYFANNSSLGWPTLYAHNYGPSGGTGLFRTLMASTAEGICGIGGAGNLTCTGQVKTLATTGGGARTVETYSTQSAENWMEDYGSGTLENGVGVVKIDPTFSETVSETADYHVFLTPNADSKGLYVINKTPTSFEVRESGGGTSTLMFDYKIVAKRRGFESQRLVDVTERFKAETKLSTHAMAGDISAPTTPVPAKPNIHVAPRLQTAPGSIKQQAELQKRPANQP